MEVDPTRSRIMRAVRRTDTKPEMVVRKLLHHAGFRYRLHRKDLAGTPDIVLPKLRTVIFVHGCFWHRHEGCSKTTSPKTRVSFWSEKFEQNIKRDSKNEAILRDSGWQVLTIWECETRNPHGLLARLLLTFQHAHQPNS